MPGSEDVAPRLQGTAGPAAQGLRAVQTDFAQSTPVVFCIMAGIMIATYIEARVWLLRGRPSQEEAPATPGAPEP